MSDPFAGLDIEDFDLDGAVRDEKLALHLRSNEILVNLLYIVTYELNHAGPMKDTSEGRGAQSLAEALVYHLNQRDPRFN